jgi:hypothetical protein
MSWLSAETLLERDEIHHAFRLEERAIGFG